MSTKHSFQLPDLVTITSTLELRANHHCRAITEASEKWVNEELGCLLSQGELTCLGPAKIGLLASLAFPTCDPPQLRILADFLTLIFYSNLRCSPAISGTSFTWSDIESRSSPDPRVPIPSETESVLSILRKHILFCKVVDPRLSRLIKKAPNFWIPRFHASLQSFRAAQKQTADNYAQKHIPPVDEYIKLVQNQHGIDVVLHLAELLEIFQVPSLQGTAALNLTTIKNAAVDIIAWSMDAVSYPLSLSKGNTNNLIAVLMHHKNLSVQGALNLCGIMIKERFTDFCTAEKSLLESLSPKNTLNISLFSWLRRSLTTSSSPSGNAEREEVLKNLQSYLRALKDCVIGTINWAYETELFFGEKGGEVRAFGWVFINSGSSATEVPQT